MLIEFSLTDDIDFEIMEYLVFNYEEINTMKRNELEETDSDDMFRRRDDNEYEDSEEELDDREVQKFISNVLDHVRKSELTFDETFFMKW